MTEPSKEQKQRITELKAIQPSDFTLREAEYVVQVDVEEWADAMADFDLTGKNMNLPRMRRLSFQAAWKIGWFVKAPELTADDFVLMPPLLVSRVGDTVLEFYNNITIPDASFTSALPTP